MRPVRLELQGFSAFRDPTVIDFADIELVAIVGPTGSGKSSIIDALTFALYGSAARYDERAVAPVINQLSTEAKVRLEFEVGEHTYTATRVVRRTKGGGATTREARLECGSEVLAGDPKTLTDKVTALLGLDFERFNKTVVLPQGKFSEFLHDKPADRQQLLRELLGFGVYDRIGRAARDRAKTLQNEAVVLGGTLSDAGDLSDEHLAELRAHNVSVVAIRQQVGAVAAKLAQSELRVTELDRELAGFEQTLDQLRDVRAPDDLEELNAAKAAALGRRQQGVTERDHARQAAKAATKAAEDGPSITDCRLLLTEYERIDELRKHLITEEARLDAARAAHDAAATVAEVVRTELARLHDEYRSAQEDSERAEGRVRNAGDRGALLALVERHKRAATLTEHLLRLRPDLSAAEQSVAEAETERDRAAAALEVLERHAPAAALAGHMTIGQPCPVCNQVVHEMPTHLEVNKSDMSAARSAAKSSAAALQRAITSRSQLEANVKVADQESATLAEQLVGQPAMKVVQNDLDELESLMKAAETAREMANKAERCHRDRLADKDVKAKMDAESSTHRQVAAVDATTEQIRSQLAALAAALEDKPSDADTRRDLATAEALDEARHQATRQVEIADVLLADADTALAEVASRESIARQLFGSLRDSLASLKPPTTTDSLANDWSTLVEWSLNHSDQVSSDLERVARGRGDAIELRDGFVASIREMAATFIADLREPGDSSAALVDAIRDRLADAEASARSAIADLERERDRVAKTRKKIETLTSDAQIAALLGQLLRADGFQRWLLEEALADLVARATVRLEQLTAGQYSLSSEDGAFKIVDHRNADEVRDVRSLSGGETFLTSLALALALADSSMDLAAEGTAQLDSIFLDEGFGTLDPDTLDVVAGTIEELGATGRLVGIITHIRELAERMPVRFEVTKGATSSTVERVET